MTKLINKLETNPSGKTGNKKTLRFSNTEIDKLIPTFGNSRFVRIPFKVPLRSHLKGLTLNISKSTRNKYFVLWYWFEVRYRPCIPTSIKPEGTLRLKHCLWLK